MRGERVGMWKFFFPETLCYYYASVNKDNSVCCRISSALNCAGTFIHHMIAAFLVAGFDTGYVPKSRVVTKCIVPLIAQHWFASVKYISMNFYIAATLLLEVWFEVPQAHCNLGSRESVPQAECVDSLLDPSTPTPAAVAAVTMLIAHWYLS